MPEPEDRAGGVHGLTLCFVILVLRQDGLSGGSRPDMAQGGDGSAPEKLREALAAIPHLLA